MSDRLRSANGAMIAASAMLGDHSRQAEAVRRYTPDDLQLTTVGIDIGSATSHLMFSRVRLRRLGRWLSSRFVIVQRETLYRSPILLTPFRDIAIDAARLRGFVSASFTKAGLSPQAIDSGAVILTGEAARRPNARAVADLFAGHAGKFVCAAAGHHLEARIAAHGSGAVKAAREARQTILNVDVGGGTSKLALVRHGEILETAATSVGARSVALDRRGRVARIDPAARQLAGALGIELGLQQALQPPDQRLLAGALADCLIATIRRGPLSTLAAQLMQTPALSGTQPIDGVMFSGGVSEYLYEREEREFRDLARPLAEALRARIAASALPAPLLRPEEGIRATAIGASQFTVQVSGDSILVSNPRLLPLRNLPVVCVELDHGNVLEPDEVQAAIASGFLRAGHQEGEQAVAIAIDWNGTPSYRALRGLAEGIMAALPNSRRAGHPVVLTFARDFGRVVGEILRSELDVGNDVISIDGIEVGGLTYLDIGETLSPAPVVPVVVKSLLFGSAEQGAAT